MSGKRRFAAWVAVVALLAGVGDIAPVGLAGPRPEKSISNLKFEISEAEVAGSPRNPISNLKFEIAKEESEEAREERGVEETLWAIQRARVVTRILYVTAHPDDEPFHLLTYLARGLNADVALLAITRGEGGQNAVGPEHGAALGMLRTEELLAATRAYGIKLFFTRAADFGYSKSPDETLNVWGREGYDDVVQVIRAYRPHIVINNWGGVRGGHGHHVAAGLLTPKAVESAADPEYIPIKVDRGLDPWKVELLLQPARGDAANALRLPTDEISPLWGRSYTEIGREGFANHRTQGIAGFLATPFPRRGAGVVSTEGKKVEVEQLAAPLMSLAARYPEQAGYLLPKLQECDKHLTAAEAAARQLDWTTATRELVAAAKLFSPMGGMPIEVTTMSSLLGWELGQVNQRIERALLLASGFRLEATADRNLIVAGGKFGVRVEWRARPGVAVEMVALRPVMRPGETTPTEMPNPGVMAPRGWTVTKEPASQAPVPTAPGKAPAPAGQSDATTARFTVSVAADAKLPPAPDEWMQPWPASPVRASAQVNIEGYRMWLTAPATVRRASSTSVATAPLTLVPAASVALQPERIFLRTGRPAPRMELLARVNYYGAEPTKLVVGIEPPKGWRVSAEQTIEFAEAGDHLLKFMVTPPATPTGVPAGAYELKAYAKRGEEVFASTIEQLPSLPERMMSAPAATQVHSLELEVPAGLRVGYVAAENDPIPGVLAQLGARVEMLDEVALAFGDLSKYDAICIGIRAYELRSDVARANPRLLDYARAGGTLVVQYQRENAWNASNPGPYPARVGQPTIRTSDENSPVRIIWPNHPVVTFPNKMRVGDFSGWVQERGLYYWGKFDSKYQPMLGLRDPGEEETLGGLVYANVGKGHYVYTGLAFFRQLPAGVPGAVRLFVNLVSQSKRGPRAQVPAAKEEKE